MFIINLLEKNRILASYNPLYNYVLDDGTVSVYNTDIRPSGLYTEICGSAYQPDPVNYPGELAVGFPTGKHSTEMIAENINFMVKLVFFLSFSQWQPLQLPDPGHRLRQLLCGVQL